MKEREPSLERQLFHRLSIPAASVGNGLLLLSSRLEGNPQVTKPLQLIAIGLLGYSVVAGSDYLLHLPYYLNRIRERKNKLPK